MTMTDELCAREGCGAPKAWHIPDTSVRQLREFSSPLHRYAAIHVAAGSCMGSDCICDVYLAPEPPRPERKAWVVELDAAYAGAMDDRVGFVPLDEYLTAHPQPSPALCICGGREDEHPDGMTCLHVGQFMNGGGTIVRTKCQCERFRAVQP